MLCFINKKAAHLYGTAFRTLTQVPKFLYFSCKNSKAFAFVGLTFVRSTP